MRVVGVEGLVKLNNKDEAREWLVDLVNRKTRLPKEVVAETFNPKLDMICDRLPFDKSAKDVKSLLFEEAVDFYLPLASDYLVDSLSKYWSGSNEIDADMFYQMTKSIDESYRRFLGEFPFFEDVFLGRSLLKDKKDDVRSIYLRVYAVHNFSRDFAINPVQLLVNYLTISTKTITGKGLIKTITPIYGAYASALLGAVLMWLVNPQGFKKYFGLHTPFHFETTDDILYGYKRIASNELTLDDVDKPFEDVAGNLYLIFKNADKNYILGMMYSYQRLVQALCFIGGTIWLNASTPAGVTDLTGLLKKRKEAFMRRLKQGLYYFGFWEMIDDFVKKYLKKRIGDAEANLINEVLNAVRTNTYALLANALGRYVKGEYKDTDILINKAKKKDAIRFALNVMTFREYVREVIKASKNLSDYDSIKCFFNLQGDENFWNALSSGIVPKGWEDKLLKDLVVEVMENFDLSEFRRKVDEAYAGSSIRPLSLTTLEFIIIQMVSYYKRYGAQKLIDRLAQMFDVIYTVGYSYRGLRAWIFIFIVLLMMKNPMLTLRIKCVGRKFTRKLASIIQEFLA